MQHAIEVRGLDKRFGVVHAVKNVSFTLSYGEVLGFLGPNGAGKSTTMKMIAGFLEPTAGSVMVGGVNLDDDPLAVKRALGYLPEGAPAYGEMSPRGFFEFVGRVRGMTPARIRERIEAVVERIHLETVIDRPIETLSKGFKRRVGLAQAILHDPKILILDEPTDGLDPNQKHEVRSLIREMSREKAIIISTHILEEVDAICSNTLIIADGRLCFRGTPAELQARSRLHNAVLLRMAAIDGIRVRPELSRLPGVLEVEDMEAAAPGTALRIAAVDGKPIIGAVSERIRALGVEPQEISVDYGRLDEVFRTITLGSIADSQRLRT
jgi:ABC-2 type transport system ATP-binding protein